MAEKSTCVDDNALSEESDEYEPVALGVLRAPKLSALNRKRKVLRNRGRSGKY